MTNEPEADNYSPLDFSFLEGKLRIKTEPMPEEQLDALLARPSWEVIEALHVACNRKLIFPSSYFITEEMRYIDRKITSALINKELQDDPSSNRKKSDSSLMIGNEAVGISIKVSLAELKDRSINSALFIEWMIIHGYPLPASILNKIGVASLVNYSFDTYWKAWKEKKYSILYQRIYPIRKSRKQWIQQNTVVQVLLLEKCPMSLPMMENFCAKHGYIPNGGYEGIDTFRTNVKSVLPKGFVRSPERMNKRSILNELKSFKGVFQNDSNVYEDLRELKIICQCIANTLKIRQPTIHLEMIYNHPLTQVYMSECHPIVWRMCENWISQILVITK